MEDNMTDGASDNGPRKPVALNPKIDPPSRRSILLAGTALAATALSSSFISDEAQAQQNRPAAAAGNKPNILVIMGDDIGQTNVSAA
jgi:hypothetical protein